MKLREVGAKIILGSMLAPIVVSGVIWASAEIVEAANRLGVLEVIVNEHEKDIVRQREDVKNGLNRLERGVRDLNKKVDRLIERL